MLEHFSPVAVVDHIAARRALEEVLTLVRLIVATRFVGGGVAFRDGRVRKRIFEIVKAVGAASHAEVLGGKKGRK